jgi:hypothetical protein
MWQETAALRDFNPRTGHLLTGPAPDDVRDHRAGRAPRHQTSRAAVSCTAATKPPKRPVARALLCSGPSRGHSPGTMSRVAMMLA